MNVPLKSRQFKRKSIPTKPTLTLVPVLLKRGNRQEFFHCPECAICGKPILDFETGNLITVGLGDGKPLESLGKVGNAEALRLPGGAIAVCFACDEDEWKPWNRLSSIFSRDQRHPAEKVGFSVAA